MVLHSWDWSAVGREGIYCYHGLPTPGGCWDTGRLGGNVLAIMCAWAGPEQTACAFLLLCWHLLLQEDVVQDQVWGDWV